MRNALPCVGLIVIGGSLSFIIAPDEPAAPAADSSLKRGLPTIVLDPGHGGRDDGAIAHGLVEKEMTLDVALRTERLLQSFGFPTALTRRNDTHLSLEQRASFANSFPHSVFVSLHFDKAHHLPASGVETFYARSKVQPENSWTWVGFFNQTETQPLDNGETLAGYIQAALVSRTDANNRGIKARDLYVVRHVRAPAVLVEGGFLSNAFDARLVGTPEYRDRLAAAVCEGVLRFQRAQPRPDTTPPRLARVAP